MRGTTTICGVVDVVGVDPDERRSGLRQILCCFSGHERMCAVGIVFSSPAQVPTSVKEYRLILHVQVLKCGRRDRSTRSPNAAHDHALEISERTQSEFAKILPTRIAMKGTVQVSARIGHHLDLADMKLGTGRVMRAGL